MPAPARATVNVAALEVPIPSGQVLRGQRWGDGINSAILIHPPGEDLDAWHDLPVHLADRGLATIAFDLPGHGLSDDPWEPSLLVSSIRAVADHARHAGSARVFVVAAEASVWSALGVAATGDADALVALSPPDFHNDEELANVRAATLPKLLLVGAGEEGRLEAVRSLFRCCGGWTVLSTLPTREQGTSLLVGPWGRQAREQIAAFLHDYQAVGSGSS